MNPLLLHSLGPEVISSQFRVVNLEHDVGIDGGSTGDLEEEDMIAQHFLKRHCS